MTGLKQSAADWCFFRGQADPVGYYRRLRELGYQGAELVPPERWSAVKAAGLKLVNVGAPGMQKGLNRKEHHSELLPQIRSLIQAAAENGIDHIILFSGNRDGQPDEAGLQNTIAAGKALASQAEAAGVGLVLELLNSFDHQDYQADSGTYIFEFARAVSSPAVKVLYDVYHAHRMLRAGAPGVCLPDDLLNHLEYVGHIHVAGSPKRDFPGSQQEIDYRSLVAQVHAAGYRGFWGQEFVPAGDPFAELAEARKLFDSYVEEPNTE